MIGINILTRLNAKEYSNNIDYKLIIEGQLGKSANRLENQAWFGIDDGKLMALGQQQPERRLSWPDTGRDLFNNIGY